MSILVQIKNQTVDNETESDKDVWWEPRTTEVNFVLSCLLVLIIMVAVLGNVLVILAVFLYHRLKEEVSNLFLVNLSIAEFSSATVIMVSSVVAVSADRWVLGGVWCSLVCTANYCFIIVSMLTLCLISLDRYLAITHPLRYPTFITRPRVLYLMAYTWLQGFCFSLTPIVFDWIEYDYWEAICAVQWHRHGNPMLIWYITKFICCFLLPAITITVAYCSIYNTVKKIKPPPSPQPAVLMVSLEMLCMSHSLHSSQSHSRHIVSVKHSKNHKAECGLLIVVLTFFICMTPFYVTKLYKVIVPVPGSLPGYASMMATVFQFTSSAVHPFIYALFRKDFKQAFNYLLRRAFRIQNPHTFRMTIAGPESFSTRVSFY